MFKHRKTIACKEQKQSNSLLQLKLAFNRISLINNANR